MAEEKKTELKSGQAALDFRLNDQDGNIVHLASFSANSEGAAKPKRVLLAFYPKDFTGG
jgi:peroxiredoxin